MAVHDPKAKPKQPPQSSGNTTTTTKSPPANNEAMATIAYLLSRIAFVMTHVVFAIWIVFVTNDPLNFRQYVPEGLLNTLDADELLEEEEGSSDDENIDWNAAVFNTLVFLVVWWLPHSGLSRNVIKHALGLGPTHPLDRPIFAFLAPFCWYITIVTWRPITGPASRLDVTQITLKEYAWRAPFVLSMLIECLGLFYLLPNHVFGTDRHQWARGNMPAPQDHKLIVAFPYSLVRHPAAAFFLWAYWIGIPSYNANHLLLASQWTVFIVIGTLVFEEGGLRQHEFKVVYERYANKVNAFVPSIWSIQHAFGKLPPSEQWKEE